MFKFKSVVNCRSNLEELAFRMSKVTSKINGGWLQQAILSGSKCLQSTFQDPEKDEKCKFATIMKLSSTCIKDAGISIRSLPGYISIPHAGSRKGLGDGHHRKTRRMQESQQLLSQNLRRCMFSNQTSTHTGLHISDFRKTTTTNFCRRLPASAQ